MKGWTRMHLIWRIVVAGVLVALFVRSWESNHDQREIIRRLEELELPVREERVAREIQADHEGACDRDANGWGTDAMSDGPEFAGPLCPFPARRHTCDVANVTCDLP